MRNKNSILKSYKILVLTLMFCFIILCVFKIANNLKNGKVSQIGDTYSTVSPVKKYTDAQAENNQVVYLSDIKYYSAEVGWGSLLFDKTSSNTQITLMLNGTAATFKKGIWAHASSEVVYDLTDYKDYQYFTTYYGVNTTSGNRGNGVKFFVQTSTDGKTWNTETETSPIPLMSSNNAVFVKIDIRNAKYLKLWAHDNGSNGNDHSVWADAKLIKEGYNDNVTKTVEEYDALIKEKYSGGDINDEVELLILQRDFVNSVGQYTLRTFCEESEQNREVFEWLFNNLENLRLYVMGGKPAGTYEKSLQVMSQLYSKYKDDFTIKTTTKYGTVLGDLYKRMAVTLSLTHSSTVALWMQPSNPKNQSDAVTRYEIYKKMHAEGYFNVTESIDINKWFESYNVEEMRFVFNNLIDDEEILWLNRYTQSFIDETPNRAWSLLTPHPYMAYVWPNYGNSVFHDPERKDYWDEKFKGIFSKYGVTYEKGTYKVWMNFRNEFGTGAVCGGISKTGSNIRTVHGIPAAVIGQPGHAAIIYYGQDEQGRGYWNLDNDVSGWTLSEKGERMLLGWGNASYSRGYSVVYMVLAQEALNDYENFEKCEKIIKLADAYKTDLEKQEELYRKAIEVQPINIDAWYGLINVYNRNPNKTENDYYDLAKELAEDLKYFPLPMYHLTNLIKTKLTSIENTYRFTLLQTRILTEASVVPNNTTDKYYVYQPSITRTEANYLLGNLDKTIATFSFDGSDANKIVLASRFDGNGVRWDYSLDGKKTWKEVSFTADEEHKWLLTDEEINSITSENDIYVHIVGVNYDEENLYKIDIMESAGIPNTLYANDWENKLIGAIPVLQWKYSPNDEWTYYSDSEPDLTGDKDVIVKVGATGVYLASNNSVTYHFTADNQPKTRKYIPISHLSIHEVSSEATNQGRHATNIIDGNINTSWHSAWDGSDTTKTIVIKFDEPKNLCSLEYFPLAGGNGKIEKAQILVSMDGENWNEVVSETNWTYRNTNDITMKSVDFEPARGQYIKIVGKKTQAASSSMSFIAGAMFNFYENVGIKLAASFSFDGENAGNIILFDEYKGANWKYSLDGGTTWQVAKGDSHKLNKKELSQINENDKIKLHINLHDEEIECSIGIKKGATPERAQYLNDLENRLIGQPNINTLEWKYSDNNDWISYEEVEPNVIGNRTLLVRTKATGIYTASDSIEYQFTEDNQPLTAKYIPIKNLSIHNYSTQSVDAKRPYYAPNVIDGNIHTQWHTDFRVSIAGKEAFIAIELNKPRYISKLEYVHMDSKLELYGHMKNGIVYVSEDGENWVEAARGLNFEKDDEVKSISFDKPVYGKYVKLVIESHDNVFASAAMINLFEDRSNIDVEAPVATIEYNPKELTNKDVEARITFDRENVKVSGGNVYVFTENGEHAFEYEDEYGNKGVAKAKVDWIDKKIPVATVAYNINEKTNQNVTATVVFNKSDVTVKDGNTHEFTENGEYTFEFEDRVGNKGTVIAKVDWIDRKVPVATIEYSTKNPTNQDVIAKITFDKENVIVEGGNTYTFIDNGEYEFKFVDEAGNKGTAKAKVDWIDRRIPKATISYDITTVTNKDVTATISFDKENVTVKDGNTHTFTENGEYIFEFVGPYGNEGTAIAKVDWIDKKVPVATINYSTKNPTNQPVVAKITFDKENVVVEGGNTHTFIENGEYEFRFVGPSGNRGTAKAKVDWIDKKLPVATITYDITELTNKDVKAEITFDKENVIVKGGNIHTFTENGEYEFEFIGPAGNKGTAKAKVDWIDKKVPVATIKYSNTSLTNQDVVAEVIFDKENVTVEGGNTYTFIENGEYTFKFEDKAGNKGTAVAVVSWIDKEAPVATIKYSNTSLTNQDVVAEVIFDKENVTVEGGNTYTFIENGEYTFKFEDKAGNKGTAVAVVSWIDKEVPIATVTYNINQKTNQSVTATVVFNESDVIVEGGNIHEFTENGEYTFEFEDRAGNKGKVIAKVDWIDRKVPVAIINYSTKNPTNQDVIAEITFDKENVTVEGGNTYTFIDNGEHEFKFVDEAGNRGTAKAKVTWIDKRIPKATISYDITTVTNKDVTATISFDKENVTVKDGNTHTFTENGEYEFEFVGPFGNKGTAIAKVDWIDKKVPVATISYSTKNPTNQPVVATVTFDKENVVVEGGNTHTFTENGEYEFRFVGPSGNKGTAIAKVDWIDKKLPVATITYDITELTNRDVKAEITFDKENVVVAGGNVHTFTENGEYEFEFVGPSGNRGTAKAKVDWIDKKIPVATIKYSNTGLTNQDVIAEVIFDKENVLVKGGNKYRFTDNGEHIFEFTDKAGNKGTAVAVVSWIDKIAPTVKVEYSTEKPTNQDVIATIVFDEEVEILNEDAYIVKYENNTYKMRFTQNSECVIEYVDNLGNKGKKELKVDWIDKVIPIAKLKYSTTIPTNESVIVTIEFSEPVIILNQDLDIIDITEDGIYTLKFDTNSKSTIEFVDTVGNKNSIDVNINWIDKKIPVAVITYDITELTNKNVIAEITFDKENVTVKDGNAHTFTENGEYTFEFIDDAGNKGTAKAKVDWIDKEAPKATIEYSTENETSNPVIVTLKSNEEIIITNNGGKDTYTFMENGKFTFEFEDKAGNKGKIEAKVDWIKQDKSEPQDKPENPNIPEKPNNPENPNKPTNSERPNTSLDNNKDTTISEGKLPNLGGEDDNADIKKYNYVSNNEARTINIKYIIMAFIIIIILIILLVNTKIDIIKKKIN